MAKILPQQPLGLVSPARMRVHRLVEGLPDRFFAWTPLGGTALPDFWVVEESSLRCVHLLVSTATEDGARGPGLFDAPESWVAPGVHEASRVANLMESWGAEINGAVLFPDVPVALLPDEVGGWPRAGREVCRPSIFGEWLESRLGPVLDPEKLREMRARFCPETVLLPRHVIRREEGRNKAPQFLSWKQEEILKTDLDPDSEGRQAAGDFGLLVVQGVAGSGKSLILLHRALLLARLRRGSKILVLTCNKPLQVELRRRFQELSGGNERVEFLTFHGFCLKRWGDHRLKIIAPARRRLLLDEALASLGRPLLLRKHVEEELAWIYEHDFEDEEAYARTPRRGRGFRVDLELRARFWQAARVFREACQKEGVTDWSLLPSQFKASFDDLPKSFAYDAVLIDEAQFFAPVWFACIRHFLAPRGHLFLSADPTQGFLRKGTSWKSVGLSVQGKSRRLERSYRSTRNIMDLAWRMWCRRADPQEADVLVPQLEGMPDGPPPEWYQFSDVRSEHSWIETQVVAFLETGDAEDLLLLHNDWGGTTDLRDRLSLRLGPNRVVEAREASSQGAVRVCPLQSATGLESPVVFVAGVQGIFERENSPDLDAEGRLQARDEATRKFFMAITRAGWRLVVTSSGPLPLEVGECFIQATQPPSDLSLEA